MTVGNIIGNYINQYGFTAKALSEKSGISASSLSRIKNAKGTVSLSSEELSALANAVEALTEGEKTADIVISTVKSCDNYSSEKSSIVLNNLNSLISFLNINVSELAKSLNFDPSYLSRIRSGERKPADAVDFALGVSRFAVKKCVEASSKAGLRELIGNTEGDLQSAVQVWLCEGEISPKDDINSFLTTLNNFNLDEYIESIHFNDIKVLTLPFNLPAKKSYIGLREMKKGELDFFRTAILSKASEDVFMHSEMPMADMAEDIDFGKKWMMSIALLIKKGVHLNIIHNLDRPWNEIMLGLEAWIPIYMTGLVSPYYIKNGAKGLFRHLNYVSATAALSGECIEGKHDKGRYYLTTNKDEVAYYKQQSKVLLEKASPLMKIYSFDEEDELNAFLASQSGYYEQLNASKAFKNIKIFICQDEWALVSKSDSPRIHFLIFHPNLVAGIENYSAPIEELL